MSMVFKEYALNERNIEAISAELQAYLRERNMETRNIQRIRLTAEELLLNIMGSPDGCERITVGLGRQFGRHLLRLRYEMAPFDPIKSGENPWVDDMMRSLGFFPSWSYRGRANTVSMVLLDRPKLGTLFYILLAALAAVLLGFVGSWLPDPLRQTLNDAFLVPAADGFLGLLKTFSGLMIVLTICSGILGMGDSASLSRTGKSVLLRFVGISFAVSIASTGMALPFLNLRFADGAQGGSSPLIQISRMFFDILPSNLVDPFQSGNTLQLIVIAIIFGVGLLAIGDQGSRLRDLVNDASGLLQHTVSAICALVPAFVFVVLLRQFWFGQAAMLLAVFKPMLILLGMMLVLTTVLWMASALRLKCSPVLLLKKVLPPFLVAFTTASSVSAMPLAMETCEKKLGANRNMVSFVYPLGSVIYMPTSVVYFSVLSCALAGIYQVEISLPWLLTEVVTATLIAIAMPPIPGADVLCYTLLFSSLGIPSEALILATTIGIVFDYVDTGLNVLLITLQTAVEAGREGDLDRDVLLR